MKINKPISKLDSKKYHREGSITYETCDKFNFYDLFNMDFNMVKFDNFILKYNLSYSKILIINLLIIAPLLYYIIYIDKLF